MENITGSVNDNSILIRMAGRVDSTNANEVEEAVNEIIAGNEGKQIVINVDKLEYISSAGLRLILRLRKRHPDMRITDVHPETYEIFDMTGFTQMIDIVKAYREVSVEGCEVIGQGSNGKIYRIDRDNVVKVYKNADALADIKHEREVARLALILGIPTAISYDVVKVGDSYGSVFELLDARSFSKIIINEPDKTEWCITEFVDMLKKIHSTVVPAGKLPSMKKTALKWVRFMKDYLPEDRYDKLLSLTEAVPEDDHMIHGDYHMNNLELVGDEVILIDMDTLAVGHPVFEFASIFNALKGFSEYNKDSVKQFLGFDNELADMIWTELLKRYLKTDNAEILKAVENKAKVIGYTRLIRRSIRRHGLETEEGRAEIELWKEKLLEALDATDTLLFNAYEVELDSDNSELDKCISFIEGHLEEQGCSPKAKMQLLIAAEEIFVNIANYAYEGGTGKAKIRIGFEDDPKTCILEFTDSGTPYDPLQRPDPDITLSADERVPGGLGIFMVKNTMDDVTYKYEDNCNHLTLVKIIA